MSDKINYKEDKANLLALDEVYKATKSGVFAQFMIITFVAIFASNYLSSSMIVLGVGGHTFVLLMRLLLSVKYHKAKKNFTSYADAKKWKKLYMLNVFSTSVIWSFLIVYLSGLTGGNNFYLYAIIMGMMFVAIMTLGIVVDIYLSFTLPMLLVLVVTFISYDNTESQIAAFFVFLAYGYAHITALKFSRNFKDVVIEKETVLLQAHIIEQVHDIVASTDLDGLITSWNQGAVKQLGYSSDEMLGKHISVIHHQDKIDELQKEIAILKEKGVHSYICELLTKTGEYIDVEVSLSMLFKQDDTPLGMVGSAKNISARIKAENELKDTLYNLQQYIDAIDKIDIGLFVVDEDYKIRYMNKTMVKWFGDQNNKTCYSSVAQLNEPCSYCKLGDVIQNNAKVIYEPITEAGESFDIVATSIKNSDGTVSKMEIIRNVTQQKKAKKQLLRQTQELDYQAHHDVLTGLSNRTLFNDRLLNSIEQSKRSKTIFALFFIDLDHFKEINDSLGHEVGDKVLVTVAKKLKKVLRQEDSISRLGGDEFTIIAKNLKDEQGATVLAQKLLDTLKDPIIVDEHTLYITTSIGISLYPNDGTNMQDLLKFSDAAMYKAKAEGRNNFQYYSSELTELALERVTMEVSLRKAIENEEFIVYYQLQVNAKEEKIIGMEALVRWQHPEFGMIPPGKFIPLAEATGLIIALDQWVMQVAMTQIVKWYADGLNPGKISLNLAMRQLEQKDFIDVLKNLIEKTHCKPEWIELEITEGQLMHNTEYAISVLKEINDLGINLAIDDFGTGYSSLSYLKKLPLNKLKIDQSFVRGLPDDEEDTAITKAVIALASSLNFKVIAEGVETVEQKEFLLANGCDNIQGYFYSKPSPASDIESILKKPDLFT